MHQLMIARNYFYLGKLNASLTAQNLLENKPEAMVR